MQAHKPAGRMRCHKVVVMGGGGVGKTSITTQFHLQHFVETYDPTGGDDYRKQLEIDGEVCLVETLDTAGQEEYTALRDQWIRDGEGFLLVYSITSRHAFEKIKAFHDQILNIKKDSPTTVVLVGNKCDLGDTPDREVSTEEGAALAKELDTRTFFETSAKTRINVDSAFEEVVRGIQAVKRGEEEGLETKQRKREEEEKRKAKEDRSIKNRLSRFIAKLKS